VHGERLSKIAAREERRAAQKLRKNAPCGPDIHGLVVVAVSRKHELHREHENERSGEGEVREVSGWSKSSVSFTAGFIPLVRGTSV
jgi:hypothetical protein